MTLEAQTEDRTIRYRLTAESKVERVYRGKAADLLKSLHFRQVLDNFLEQGRVPQLLLEKYHAKAVAFGSTAKYAAVREKQIHDIDIQIIDATTEEPIDNQRMVALNADTEFKELLLAFLKSASDPNSPLGNFLERNGVEITDLEIDVIGIANPGDVNGFIVFGDGM